MPTAEVRDREERFEDAPRTRRRGRFLFENSTHDLSTVVYLVNRQPNDGSRNDRGGRLADSACFGLVRVIGDDIAIELDIYGDPAPAKPAMCIGGRVRRVETTDPRY